jgi:hypothetical protein
MKAMAENLRAMAICKGSKAITANQKNSPIFILYYTQSAPTLTLLKSEDNKFVVKDRYNDPYLASFSFLSLFFLLEVFGSLIIYIFRYLLKMHFI